WKDCFRDPAARLGLPASGLAGLHAHFFLATALHAAPGDAGALVTAAEWLDVNYGSLIRALLLGPLGGESIHLLDPAAAMFPDAAATSAITRFRPGSKPRAIGLRQVAEVTGLGGLTGGTPVPADVLRSAPRWRPLAARPSGPRRRPEGMVELGELCRVRRGQVTGANKVWITAGDGSGLPARFLMPAVTRASELFRAGDTLASSAGLRRGPGGAPGQRARPGGGVPGPGARGRRRGILRGPAPQPVVAGPAGRPRPDPGELHGPAAARLRAQPGRRPAREHRARALPARTAAADGAGRPRRSPPQLGNRRRGPPLRRRPGQVRAGRHGAPPGPRPPPAPLPAPPGTLLPCPEHQTSPGRPSPR